MKCGHRCFFDNSSYALHDSSSARGRVAARGTPDALKATAGPDATLDDVFAQVAGGSIETGGSYRDVRRTRTTARRLG